MSRRRTSKVPRPFVILPWMASLVVHLGLGLLAVFVIYLVGAPRGEERPHVVMVPNAFGDPTYAEHPGLGSGTGDVAHPSLGSLDGGTGNAAGMNVAAMIGGQGPLGNSLGGGGPVAAGMPGGTAAVGGVPTGSGTAPHSTLFKSGGDGKKIVYILDHSGSMVDNFEFLKQEAVKSVNRLEPLQFFAVILVSDKATPVGPERLQRADTESKAEFARLIRNEVPENNNDGLLEPFRQAFEKAFKMEPDLIYFLTDGKFGDGLIAKVAQMNKLAQETTGKRVSINTIAFVTEEPQYKGQLQQLAGENGGNYTFVPLTDLGH